MAQVAISGTWRGLGLELVKIHLKEGWWMIGASTLADRSSPLPAPGGGYNPRRFLWPIQRMACRPAGGEGGSIDQKRWVWQRRSASLSD